MENVRKCVHFIANNFFVDEQDGAAPSAIDRETETSGDTLEGQEHRVIFINRAQPPVAKYCNNRISTAKYR